MSAFPTLCGFLDACVTPFHTVACCKDLLCQAGYTELFETDVWQLTLGGKYFFVRNDSALVAFVIPKRQAKGLLFAAAHGDSPAFMVKKSVKDDTYTRLSVERYGGMLYGTWFDRPLSVAGRVMVRTDNGVQSRLVNLAPHTVLIPSVAPHLNKEANTAPSYDVKTDLLALYGRADADLEADVAKAAGVDQQDIVAKELYLYSHTAAYTWGENNAFVTSARLDDLQCVWALLKGFLSASNSDSVSVLTVLNHEEVGSSTNTGANSPMLEHTVSRILSALSLSDEEKAALLSGSYFISADNAHARHPNHPELSDGMGDVCQMGGGIVIKRAASKSYTTDALSEALFVALCERADVPFQRYTNRADLPGGSTLGALAVRHLPGNMIDIGLAQLAMHSACETASLADADVLAKAMQVYFSSTLCQNGTAYVWKERETT